MMLVLLISSTLIFGAITGFVFFTEGKFLCGVAGQVYTWIVKPCMFRARRNCFLGLWVENWRD